MLKDNAKTLLELGEELGAVQLLWTVYGERDENAGQLVLSEKGQPFLRSHLTRLLALSRRLELSASMKLIGRRLGYNDYLPKTENEFDVVAEVLKDEIEGRLFLFVPEDRSAFWEKDDLLSDQAKIKFPRATAELRSAGNAYAAALAEGSIYYSMRALEHGLHALANSVERKFDAQNWQNIINEIESQVENWRKNGIPGMEKATKDARLQFLSEAAKEFAYFKDGWRNYVAHVKVSYTQGQARIVLAHVTDFIEHLSIQLAE